MIPKVDAASSFYWLAIVTQENEKLVATSKVLSLSEIFRKYGAFIVVLVLYFVFLFFS